MLSCPLVKVFVIHLFFESGQSSRLDDSGSSRIGKDVCSASPSWSDCVESQGAPSNIAMCSTPLVVILGFVWIYSSLLSWFDAFFFVTLFVLLECATLHSTDLTTPSWLRKSLVIRANGHSSLECRSLRRRITSPYLISLFSALLFWDKDERYSFCQRK